MSASDPVSTGPRKRLMIVEDSADYRALLKKLFMREGYDVACAGHGQEALTQLSGEGSVLPDVILLDLMMPVMDGFEFRARQIEDTRLAKIPVVLMTAHGNLQTDPVKLGIRDFIRKPVEMTQLLNLIKKSLLAG